MLWGWAAWLGDLSVTVYSGGVVYIANIEVCSVALAS